MKWSRSCESLTHRAGARHTCRVNKAAQASVWKVCVCLPWLWCGLMRCLRSTRAHGMNGGMRFDGGWGLLNLFLPKGHWDVWRNLSMYRNTCNTVQRRIFRFYLNDFRTILLLNKIHKIPYTVCRIFLPQKSNFGCWVTNVFRSFKIKIYQPKNKK